MGTIWKELVLLFNANPALITFIWTVISFGFGLWFGVWYGDKKSVSRYRLDKFNNISDPIEIYLTKELAWLESGDYGSRKLTIDFDPLSLHLPAKYRYAYKQAVDEYLTAMIPFRPQSFFSGAHIPSVDDSTRAIAAIRNLLTFAKHQ
ncbi:hypothetical protein QX227_08085 [Pectobacterium aroidearum]|uniref:hypothetical protein n=1 Tax=Pectobacterium aroidearum TaxID=1201031 RepID=UPI002FC5D16E